MDEDEEKERYYLSPKGVIMMYLLGDEKKAEQCVEGLAEYAASLVDNCQQIPGIVFTDEYPDGDFVAIDRWDTETIQ